MKSIITFLPLFVINSCTAYNFTVKGVNLETVRSETSRYTANLARYNLMNQEQAKRLIASKWFTITVNPEAKHNELRYNPGKLYGNEIVVQNVCDLDKMFTLSILLDESPLDVGRGGSLVPANYKELLTNHPEWWNLISENNCSE